MLARVGAEALAAALAAWWRSRLQKGLTYSEVTMVELLEAVAAAIGADHVSSGASISDDYAHDEALTVPPVLPALVARPAGTADVAALVAIADEHRVPITARGSGTGLSGACTPTPEIGRASCRERVLWYV